MQPQLTSENDGGYALIDCMEYSPEVVRSPETDPTSGAQHAIVEDDGYTHSDCMEYSPSESPTSPLFLPPLPASFKPTACSTPKRELVDAVDEAEALGFFDLIYLT